MYILYIYIYIYKYIIYNIYINVGQSFKEVNLADIKKV